MTIEGLDEALAPLEQPQAVMLTVPQVAALLQVHERTVWRWLGEGRLRARHITNRCTRIARNDLDTFIEES